MGKTRSTVYLLTNRFGKVSGHNDEKYSIKARMACISATSLYPLLIIAGLWC